MMSETKPTYDFTATPPAPDAEPPSITDKHMRFLHGMIGKTWVSADYSVSAAEGEKLFSDVIVYLDDRRRAEGWL